MAGKINFKKVTQPALNALSSVLSLVEHSRLKFILGVFLFFTFVFLCRLIFLQVIMADHYSAMAQESRTITFETTPRRGTIYDRNGLVLATSVDATTVYVNPSEVTNADWEASQIASILGGEAKDYVDALKKRNTTFAYVKRQVDVDVAKRLKELKLDGIYFIEDTRREYPNGAVGGQVIGFCDAWTGEGITGLEYQYDDILAGKAGTYKAEHGEKGTPIPGGVIEEVTAVDGQDIMISLDIKLQEIVEASLKDGAEEIGVEKGSSVVMDGGTGEIYAICSLPYLDPTNLMEMEVGADQVTAITQAIEPGSIFKTVTALSILESGAMGTEDSIWCPAVISADGYEVSDAKKRADDSFTLREIINRSSNVGISLAIEKAGFNNLANALTRYHLGQITGVDYPGENPGAVRDFNYWGRIIGYNVSFGQGIAVTPLQMVRYYGALTNDGVLVTPHFLTYKPQTDERPVYGVERVCFNKKAMADMTSMLRTVVTDGTGKTAEIEGYDVVGKSSTAEIAENGTYSESIYNLAFLGFIANSSSKLVCYVGVNEAASEASVAHIFRNIMANAVEQYNVVSLS